MDGTLAMHNDAYSYALYKCLTIFQSNMLLYFESEQFLAPSKASLRTQVFEASLKKAIKTNPKHLYALVASTLKYREFIQAITKNSKLLKQPKLPKKLSNDLCLLLVHDLLFTKAGRIQSSKHPIKDFIIANKTRLKSEYIKLKLKYKVKDFDQLVEDDTDANDYTPVRWFRINTIKVRKPETFFAGDALLLSLTKVDTLDQVISQQGNIYHDEYIPNLFGVNPKDKIVNTGAYKEGKLIIQDRSSCFPAHILSPAPGDKLIDSCAAPGNKTTHAASYLHNTKNSIVAFEKNPNRAQTLTKMVNMAGASNCVKVKCGDFTAAVPDNHADVVGFIVDPSCSGSGIFGRQENKKAHSEIVEEQEIENADKERLAKLSSFQFTIVRHALSFPGAKKLVYSTCSIHPEENEQVVIDLLNDGNVQKQGWRLCSRKDVIPTWERRGWKSEFSKARFTEEEAEKLSQGCIRSLPKIDGGIGFFAAAFERSL